MIIGGKAGGRIRAAPIEVPMTLLEVVEDIGVISAVVLPVEVTV